MMKNEDITVPGPSLAAELAAATIGVMPKAVTRFTTGSMHYVYEVRFDARAPVVVRIGRPESRAVIAAAIALSGQLRPLGVPLPAVLQRTPRRHFPSWYWSACPAVTLAR